MSTIKANIKIIFSEFENFVKKIETIGCFKRILRQKQTKILKNSLIEKRMPRNYQMKVL